MIPPLPADVFAHVVAALGGLRAEAAGQIVGGLVASGIVTRDTGNEILLSALLRPQPSTRGWIL